MWGIVYLHDHVLFFLCCILFVVLYIFYYILRKFSYANVYRYSDWFYHYRRNTIRFRIKQRNKRKYTWSKLRHGMELEII